MKSRTVAADGRPSISSVEVEEVKKLIAQGENETVEFKFRVPSPTQLAKLIASFANATGGLIIIGVSDLHELAEVDFDSAERAFIAAQTLLKPQPPVTLEKVVVEENLLALIRIRATDAIILAEGGTFVRKDATIRAMTPNEILQRLEHSGQATSKEVAELAQGLAELTTIVIRQNETAGRQNETISRQNIISKGHTRTIEALRQELRVAGSLKRRVMEWLISGVIGAILGQILTSIFG